MFICYYHIPAEPRQDLRSTAGRPFRGVITDDTAGYGFFVLGWGSVPVTAYAGAEGGYEIAEQFRLDHQLAALDDRAYILTALRGLVSATDDPKAKGTL